MGNRRCEIHLTLKPAIEAIRRTCEISFVLGCLYDYLILDTSPFMSLPTLQFTRVGPTDTHFCRTSLTADRLPGIGSEQTDEDGE